MIRFGELFGNAPEVYKKYTFKRFCYEDAGSQSEDVNDEDAEKMRMLPTRLVTKVKTAKWMPRWRGALFLKMTPTMLPNCAGTPGREGVADTEPSLPCVSGAAAGLGRGERVPNQKLMLAQVNQ